MHAFYISSKHPIEFADLFLQRTSSSAPAISPDLSRSAVVVSLDALKEVVLKGALQPNGMPRFGDVLTAADVSALQGYLIDQWWHGYDTEKANPEKSAH